MLNYLSDNLNMLMSKARINSNELARQIGIPATTIKRIRNNEQANPTITTLLPIAKYFSISLNQLIGNESLIPNNLDKTHKIPLLSWRECIHYSLLDYEKIPTKIVTERTVSSKAFALTIEDQDLEVFPKDCVLIADPDKKPESGDYIVVGNIEQNIISIRKYIIEIDQIYLKPLVKGVGISILTPQYTILAVIIQYKVELKS